MSRSPWFTKASDRAGKEHAPVDTNAEHTAPAPPDGVTATSPPFRPQKDQVLVRMYGQGLGDCFLLAFPRAGVPDPRTERPVYVLIDCGVLSGTPGSSTRMKQIVEDIRLTTQDDSPGRKASDKSGHLDLLVITHEHWDHLSGFIYADAREEWKQIQVDNVWTGWTARHEPNGLAGVLQKIKDVQAQSLALIEGQVGKSGVANAIDIALGLKPFGVGDRLATAAGLNRFLADKAEAPDRTLASGLEFVIEELGKKSCTYCEPGEVRPVPGTDSVAYVLGPPRNWKRLSKMDPTSRTPETYGNPFALWDDLPAEKNPNVSPAPAEPKGAATSTEAITSTGAKEPTEQEQVRAVRRMLEEPSALTAFVSSLQGRLAASPDTASGGNGQEELTGTYYRALPFDRSFRIPLAIAESDAANDPASYPVLSSYFDSVNQWRRIDDDWLLAADTFALAANNFVNNTSLVLAFELPPAKGSDRRNVLLFVADAQVGNWLSWDEIPEWTLRDEAKPAQARSKPDIDDLLKRTVFYKVGHHGSHNATLKEKGVERMTEEGTLTAFVPVSAAVASNVGWDEMPLKAMLDALSERADGRVVLPGGVWPPIDDPEELRKARKRIGVDVSSQMLVAKTTVDDAGQVIPLEDEVPLWAQIAIDY